jgi:carbohydrate-selective porin OprB
MRSFLPVIAALVLALSDSAVAQTLQEKDVESSAVAQSETTVAPPAQVNPYEGSLFTRPYLTGDWNGRRSQLAASGVTWDLFATQFYQGVTSGGLSQEFEYGGKLDFLPNFDGQKLGLWQGLSANAHVESRFGRTTNSISGTLLQTNAAMAFPFDPDPTSVWLTAFKFNQAVSEHLILFAGKINGLALAHDWWTPAATPKLKQEEARCQPTKRSLAGRSTGSSSRVPSSL